MENIIKNKWLHILFWLTPFFFVYCSISSAEENPQPPDTYSLIPADPGTLGYTVNNQELQFKEHLRLPKNTLTSGGGMIDHRYRLTNLIADEQGNYFSDREKKIVIVDTQTGEIKPTEHKGDIKCFVDGNLAILINAGRRENVTFFYGKYGEKLQTWQGVVEPEGTRLNLMSCTLQSWELLKIDHPPGMSVGRVILRPEHGQLVTLAGPPLAGNTPNAPPEVRRLMQHPFMQNMTLPAHSERWILKKTNGELMPIPKNPGEAANGNTVTYLPYMDAYFMEAATRPFIPDELKRIPRFSRILYPDGRVVRFGVPDVIMQPSLRGEINFRSIYTKAGLIWRIQYVRIDRVGRTNYKGELNEGYYLDQRDTKVLRKLPEVSSTSPVDGCIVGTRAEITQKHPHLLLNSYYINLCSGQ